MNILDFVLNWILNWIIFRPDSMKKWIFKTYRLGLVRHRKEIKFCKVLKYLLVKFDIWRKKRNSHLTLCALHCSVKWKYRNVVDYKSSNIKKMRFSVPEKNKEHLSFDSSSGWLVVHFVKEGDLCSDSRQLRREGGKKHKTSWFLF